MNEIDKLLEERGKTHGPYRDFAMFVQSVKYLIAEYQTGVMGSPELAESLEMVVHKIGRIVTGNPHHRDHWDDIAGYATLASKSIKENVRTLSQGEASNKAQEQMGQGVTKVAVPTQGYRIDGQKNISPAPSWYTPD